MYVYACTYIALDLMLSQINSSLASYLKYQSLIISTIIRLTILKQRANEREIFPQTLGALKNQHITIPGK
jgi:hypothetical protein